MRDLESEKSGEWKIERFKECKSKDLKMKELKSGKSRDLKLLFFFHL